MDWDKAKKRLEPGTVEARVFGGVMVIIRARKRTPHFHAHYPSQVIATGNPQLFAFVRAHPLGNLLAIYNVSEDAQPFPAGLLPAWGLAQPYDALEGRLLEPGEPIRPYGRLWLV
jgi:amylosucrase